MASAKAPKSTRVHRPKRGTRPPAACASLPPVGAVSWSKNSDGWVISGGPVAGVGLALGGVCAAHDLGCVRRERTVRLGAVLQERPALVARDGDVACHGVVLNGHLGRVV